MMTESRRPRPDADDDLGRLLRAAGARPGVPEARTRRVRSAAREAWRETVQERRAGVSYPLRAGLVAAAIVLVALATWTLTVRDDRVPAGDGPRAPVEVVRVVGTVSWTDAGGDERAARAGSEVGGDATWTTGASASVALRWPTGHELRLDADTELMRDPDGTPDLRRGAVYVDSGVGPRRASAALPIRTPRGTVVDLGTRYEVRIDADASLRIRVREGEVRLHREAAGPIDVVAGEDAAVTPDGVVERRSIDPDDAAWSWLRAAEPPFVLDGSTLADFLAWCERERGVRFRFDDPASAPRPAAIALAGGSLDGFDTDDALTAVLTTCGWTWERDAVTGVVVLRIASVE
jgi:hypothetical protein